MLINIKKNSNVLFLCYNEFGDRMEKEDYPLTIKKLWKHFQVVNKHRWKVFGLCCKVGIPWRGLVHDLSKYEPVEFFETARYFEEGKYSPVKKCKEIKGYSLGWIHHKNHNKHHYEYWYDYNAKTPAPIMPCKYFLELICDSLAAGMTYQGKNWTKEYQLEYWKRAKEKAILHPKMEALIEKVYEDISKEGIDPVLKKKRLVKLYQDYTK